VTLAEVRLWGSVIGAASLAEGDVFASFEYDPGFAASGIELAPLVMPLAARRVYRFPDLAVESFRGLPGLLSDSLPDRFGRRIVDAWLAEQGRPPGSLNALEHLCYIGARGMGALEFAPATRPASTVAERLHVDALVAIVSEILSERAGLSARLEGTTREEALAEVLKVGTSAGGARAKAIIVWNRGTNEVRSGQGRAPEGFEHWLLKLAGISGNRDKEDEDPKDYGTIEYAYAQMARRAGIEMPETHLFDDGTRRHFMVRRFDRTEAGDKVHVQSLGALAHLDYNDALANSYEQAFLAIRRLGLPQSAVEEQFRRMVFNIVARNQDDHVKNIAFLMDRRGEWSLSPAFDVTYSYNPGGRWTGQHQMSAAGKRDGFTLHDLRQIGRTATLKRGRADAILGQVRDAVTAWPELAGAAGVAPREIAQIASAHRLALPPG
jgi:serine/threonine-protein kinase HipA